MENFKSHRLLVLDSYVDKLYGVAKRAKSLTISTINRWKNADPRDKGMLGVMITAYSSIPVALTVAYAPSLAPLTAFATTGPGVYLVCKNWNYDKSAQVDDQEKE